MGILGKILTVVVGLALIIGVQPTIDDLITAYTTAGVFHDILGIMGWVVPVGLLAVVAKEVF